MPADNTPSLPAADTKLCVPEDVMMRQVGDELVMLNLGAESYFGLNDVGARVMQLAQAGATLEDIIGQVHVEFDVTREQLEADIGKVVVDLLSAGLLEARANS